MQGKRSTPTLRERRRRQTAREIQSAALELALERGLDQVTTAEIARRASISPRTFFNYYSNKEAAVIGEAPPLPAEELEAFARGEEPLGVAIHRLMRRHAEQIEADREIVGMLRRVARRTPEIHKLLDEVIDAVTEALAEAIAARTGRDAQMARLLAELAQVATRAAVDLWIDGAFASFPEAMDSIWSRLDEASRLIARPE